MSNSLSKAAHNAIKLMFEAEQRDDLDAAEIVEEGREVWIGYKRTTVAVLYELLYAVLIRDVSLNNDSMRRYTLNEDGRKAVADPTWRPPEMLGKIR